MAKSSRSTSAWPTDAMDTAKPPDAPYTSIALAGASRGLFHTSHHTPLAHVVLAVGVGYLDEPEDIPGLAHLLEHVLLTQPGPEGASLLAFTEALGGKLNARTDDLITDIHATLPVAALPRFLEYLGETVFTPVFAQATVAQECAAIDGEYQARQGTSELHRLHGIQRLAEPGHPGAVGHHGSKQSLGGTPAELKQALERFHARYYARPRLSLGLTAPLSLAHQRALAEALLAASRPGEPTPPPPPRWARTSHQAVVEGAGSRLELLWPLESAALAGQMPRLEAVERSLNAGALLAPLAGLADDYRVTLCPSGATDTLALRVHLPPHRQRELLSRAESITRAIEAALPTASAYAPGVDDEPSLAARLASRTRRQALSQRFAKQDTHNEARLLAAAPHALLSGSQKTAAQPRKRAAHTLPTSVISRVGASGSFDLPAHWFAGFYPGKAIRLPALARQHLAVEGVTLLQHASPQGSWLCAHAHRPLTPALCKALAGAWLAPPPAPTGLQAHRLLAELAQSPTAPLTWSDSAESAATLSPLLATLDADAPSEAFKQETAPPPSDSVTLMRTLALAGSDTHRRVLSLAARRHGAPFFRAVRQTHRLGYIAAVRFVDGDPAQLAYIVQCAAGEVARVKALIQAEIEALWEALLAELANEAPLPGEFLGLDIPETPGAALVAQWRSHLNATQVPLYRLAAWEQGFSLETWRQYLNAPAHWQWWQRPG
ncbi:insulinase family protein [Vreelandella sp. EE7]